MGKKRILYLRVCLKWYVYPDQLCCVCVCSCLIDARNNFGGPLRPPPSVAAKWISVVSTTFVAVSIVGMTISTLPALQYQDAQVTPPTPTWPTGSYLT